jgi:integrase
MATDGVSLFYNPEFVGTLNAAELAGVLAHEVMHPALQHHTRRGDSEIRGLKWMDIDFEQRWINLRRGIVRTLQTKLKTEGSQRGVPLPPDLAEVLLEWREQTPYKADTDWVFASPETKGKNPLWLDVVLRNYIKPVVASLGIKKTVGWHTWRHSLATLLATKGEQVKVVQELLRHANVRTTMDIYQEADVDLKRAAQEHTKSLFIVKKAS